MEIEFNGLVLSSECNEEDEAMGFDENGIIYSCDGRRLLKATSKCANRIIVREETLVICDNAFCESTLSEVVLPDSLIVIGKRSFKGSMVKNINIPDSVEDLGDEVFGDCAELEEIRFGKKIKHIRHEFFRTYFSNIDISKRTIKRLVIAGAIEIADNTFEGFHRLESVLLGDGLVKIGEKAFSSCTGLQRIDIPNSVKEMGYGAFWGCSKIQTITFGTGLRLINDATFEFCGIQEICIPDNIVEIRDMAFFHCDKLLNVHLGKSLKKIGWSAFSTTRIEEIEIPENVEEISSQAFGDCYYLAQVQILNPNAKIGECAFKGCNSITENCRVNLIERFGPFVFQFSTASKIKGFFSDLWDALTDSSYKNPLFNY